MYNIIKGGELELEDQFMGNFSKRMALLRQNKGISARDMSLSLGLSHNYIHNIESEKNYPTMLNFFYICEYLKITPEEFFNYGQQTPELDNELYAEIQKLDMKSKEYYLNLIRETNNRPR